MTPSFTEEDRREAVELLKRFVLFLESKRESDDTDNIDMTIDIVSTQDAIDILEDWRFYK